MILYENYITSIICLKNKIYTNGVDAARARSDRDFVESFDEISSILITFSTIFFFGCDRGTAF